MQRFASRMASSLEYEWRTSRKSVVRSATVSSEIATRTGFSFGGAGLGAGADSAVMVRTYEPARPIRGLRAAGPRGRFSTYRRGHLGSSSPEGQPVLGAGFAREVAPRGPRKDRARLDRRRGAAQRSRSGHSTRPPPGRRQRSTRAVAHRAGPTAREGGEASGGGQPPGLPHSHHLRGDPRDPGKGPAVRLAPAEGLDGGTVRSGQDDHHRQVGPLLPEEGGPSGRGG